jgi:hypothetical protein
MIEFLLKEFRADRKTDREEMIAGWTPTRLRQTPLCRSCKLTERTTERK